MCSCQCTRSSLPSWSLVNLALRTLFARCCHWFWFLVHLQCLTFQLNKSFHAQNWHGDIDIIVSWHTAAGSSSSFRNVRECHMTTFVRRFLSPKSPAYLLTRETCFSPHASLTCVMPRPAGATKWHVTWHTLDGCALCARASKRLVEYLRYLLEGVH